MEHPEQTMKADPVILGLLQNQWAHNPARVAETLRRNANNRHAIIRFMLVRSASGHQLQRALGDWFEEVTWDNASPEITTHPGACPVPDVAHINRLLASVKPDIVIVFGKQACMGIKGSTWSGVIIEGPHPAARAQTVQSRLCALKEPLASAWDAHMESAPTLPNGVVYRTRR